MRKLRSAPVRTHYPLYHLTQVPYFPIGLTARAFKPLRPTWGLLVSSAYAHLGRNGRKAQGMSA